MKAFATRFFVPLLAALALGAAASAQARPPICGDTLYQSIVLQADLVCGPGQTGLIIVDNGVRIDLNGFSIRGTGNQLNVGVYSYGYDRVEIVGPGSIEGFEWATFLSTGSRHRVSDLKVPAGTVILFNLSDSTVEHNRLASVMLQSGGGGRSTATWIASNEFILDPAYSFSTAIGLYGCETAGNVVADNNQPWVNYAHAAYSVQVGDGAHDNEIQGNTVTRRLSVEGGAHSNRVSRNVLAMDGTGQNGLELWTTASNCAGGVPSAPFKNVFVDNKIFDAGYGISLWGTPGAPVADNEFHSNTIMKPMWAGMRFGPDTKANDARGNSVIGRVPYAIDQGTGNLWP